MKRTCLTMTLTAAAVLLTSCDRSFLLSQKHQETASAQTLSSKESLRQAKQSAWEAAILVQNPPHPVERWQEAKLKWRRAIRLLEAIPQGMLEFKEAQRKLVDYRSKFDAITQRLNSEEMAIDAFEQAQTTAWQAAVTVQGPLHSLQGWRRASERWQRAIQLIRSIPPHTTVSTIAQQKLNGYRQNHHTIAQRLATENQVFSILDDFSGIVQQLNTRQIKALTNQTKDPIGVTYKEYQAVVRSLKTIANQLDNIPVAKRNPAYADIKIAIMDYQFALTIWDEYLRLKQANASWLQNGDFFDRLIPLSSIDGDRLLQRYEVNIFPGSREAKVPLRSAVWAIWEKANDHATAAQEKTANLR